MDAHEMVSAVKELAIELGRTPTRREFVGKIRGGDYNLAKIFGGFVPLLAAAGLEPLTDRDRRKASKITNDIFKKDIESHLESYEPRPEIERPPFPKMAVISDIHWPFESKRVIEKFFEYVLETQPEWVIVNGDAWDMYSHSKFPRSHNVFTPREEEALARKKNEEFWKEVQRVAKGAKCIQMMGNHDVRPMKRVLEVMPSAEDWIQQALERLFTFDNVRTIFDPREELMIGDIAVFHGYKTQLGAHRDFTLYHCINGHSHMGGTVFRRLRGQTLFEGNSGLAGDPESKGLTYTPQKITNWTPGFLGVDKFGPRFIMA